MKCFIGCDVLVIGFFIGVFCLVIVLKNFGKLYIDNVVVLVLVIVMDGDIEVFGWY